MQWFISWWDSLIIVQQVFACIAIPATVVLILQTILLLFGVGGGHDADNGADFADDASGDASGADASGHDISGHDGGAPDHDGAHHAAGLRVLTVRGLVAFFAVGGWLGVALIDTGLPVAAAAAVAFVGGVLALLLVAWMLKWSLSLQDSGNIDIANAVGMQAQVYLTIPAKQSGTGKVTLTVQERYLELDAMTAYAEAIKPGALVVVTGTVNSGTLLVEPAAVGDGYTKISTAHEAERTQSSRPVQ